MKKIILFLLGLILLVVVGLAYIGVVPFLSPLLNKPRDLGMTADPRQVYDFEQQYGAKNGEEMVDIDVELSDSMITSVMAVWDERDVNFPLRDVQVKFHPDGTGEASGILELPTAIGMAKSLGYSDSDIEKGKQYVQYVAGDLPFYVKGTGGMTDNRLSINPNELQIGRVNVPSEITTPLTSLVSDMISRRIEQIGGANIQRADFSTGTFVLEGSVPATIDY